MKTKLLDKLKIVLALHFLGGGLVVFYSLPSEQSLLRFMALLAGSIFCITIILFSDFGKVLIAYVRSSIEEGRKVVWPARQESLRLTLLVFVFVLILSLFMWLVDSILFWVFNDLLLRRG
jgi:preprotein translocase subunit SecE